jgi:hypothetical protein
VAKKTLVNKKDEKFIVDGAMWHTRSKLLEKTECLRTIHRVFKGAYYHRFEFVSDKLRDPIWLAVGNIKTILMDNVKRRLP